MTRTVEGVTIEITEGDIAAQPDIDAVVNAANAQLRTGGGVAGALHRAAGPGLAAEAVPKGPIQPGDAVVTGAHLLPNRFVIHALGPVYGRDEPSADLLAAAYRNCLQAADSVGASSIAFPAISTGAFGYPLAEAADIAVGTIVEQALHLTATRHVRFVLWEGAALQVHIAALERVTSPLS